MLTAATFALAELLLGGEMMAPTTPIATRTPMVVRTTLHILCLRGQLLRGGWGGGGRQPGDCCECMERSPSLAVVRRAASAFADTAALSSENNCAASGTGSQSVQ